MTSREKLVTSELDDLEAFAPIVDMDIDSKIRRNVLILRMGGVETFESCEGGDGHAYPEPTVRFHGGPAAGWHALSVCFTYALPVSELRRTWPVLAGIEPTGPYWELTFRAPAVQGEEKRNS